MKKLFVILMFASLTSRAQWINTRTRADSMSTYYNNMYSTWQTLQNYTFSLDSAIVLFGDTLSGAGDRALIATKYWVATHAASGTGDSGITTTVYSMLGYSKLANSATKPRTLTLNAVANSSPTIAADTVAITSVNNTMSSSDTVLQISVAGVVDGGYGVTYGIDYHKTIATTTPSTGSSYHNVILTFVTHASDSCIVSQGSAGITRTKSHWNTIVLQGTATSIFSVAINRFGTLVKIAVSQDQQ